MVDSANSLVELVSQRKGKRLVVTTGKISIVCLSRGALLVVIWGWGSEQQEDQRDEC